MSTPRRADLSLDDAAARGDRAALAEALVERIGAASARVVAVDVGRLTADATALDALARLQLAAQRAGASLMLEHASAGLCALLDLCGLAAVLPPAAAGVETAERVERLEPVLDAGPLDAALPPAS